jgi:hypothetical protein
MNRLIISVIKKTVFSIALIVLLTVNFAFGQCDPPFVTGPGRLTLDAVRISWFSVDIDNIAWELELVEKGEPFTGIASTPATTNWYYDFTGLKSGTEYSYNIRSICASGNSDWNGPYKFITSLPNDDFCNLDFLMQDATSNDAAENYFYLVDTLFNGKKLGQDVFIQNVELIIAHEWPADLTLLLRSPTGVEIVLSEREGFNSNHYGSPGTDCNSKIIFSDNACNSVAGQIPLVGSFRPEESFAQFYDNSELDGNWVLIVRDNSPGHRGILKYFRINLVEKTCSLPQEIFLTAEGPSSCGINWSDAVFQPDSIIIEYGPFGFVPGTGNLITIEAAQQNHLLGGLEPGTSYQFYFKALCGEEISDISCPYEIETACHQISLRDHFNGLEACQLDCQSVCQVSGIWFNKHAPYNQWLVNQGGTATEGTGPQGDISGYGKYIYVESSENNCGFDTLAVLETDCLEFLSNGDGCDFSFRYHMDGPDIGKLKFQLTTNDGKTWKDLFEQSGSQGNEWQYQVIDFSEFEGLVGRVRFVAELLSPELDRGDIALDELVFYGTKPVTEAQYLFYSDSDGDDYGDYNLPPVFFCSNSLVEGFSRNDLDCDDNNPNVNPGADEIPCNAIDENCNGMDDDLDLDNPMAVEVILQKHETCNGLDDGEIILAVSGGQGPYVFSWSDGRVDSIITNLEDGLYSCEITDAFGCKISTDSIEIEAGPSLTFELVDKSIISCGGAKDGSITIENYGGTAPYSYQWNSGDTTKNLVGLETGSYQVTITDDVGCQVVSPWINLIAATKFIVGLDIKAPLCHGDSNGSLKILGIQDGTPPFTYQWSTGDTTEHVNQLEAGNYALTITDASLCYEVIDSIVIIDPEPLNVDVIAKDDVSCFGFTDGAIEVNATGGTSPYTFRWTRDGNVYSNKDDLFSLESGTYQLRLRDNNGCELFTEPILVSQPEQITITIDSLVQADCKLSENGTISINVQGGTGDYHYFWNGENTGGPVYSQLNPGIYNVVVTDKYGCKGFRNDLEIKSLDKPLTLTVDVLEDIPCFGDSIASIGVEVQKGKQPLDFNWSAGVKRIKNSLTDSLFNLSSGQYNVTVTDAEGCVGKSIWVDIGQPEKMAYEVIEVRDIECSGKLTGLIKIEATGGTGNLEISWNNGKSGTEIRNLTGGYYHAVISDSKDCILETDSIFLFEPDPIAVEVIATPAHAGLFNGTATVIPSGGTTPYEFLWDEQTGHQTGQTAVGLDAGTYYVTVTDYYGCEKEALVIVPLATGVNPNPLIEELMIFPNPADHFITVVIPADVTEDFELDIIESGGTTLKSSAFGIKQFDQKILIRLDELSKGFYLIRISSADKMMIGRFVKM